MYQRLKNKIFSWLGLQNYPVVKVYNGFGNESVFYVMGHVLSLSPRQRKSYSKNIFRNMIAVIRLFLVKPMAGETVSLTWGIQTYEAVTEIDGFFKFEIRPAARVSQGWKDIMVTLKSDANTKGYASVFIPPNVNTGFISDVDDTFLISHTNKTRRRLRELFTHNERNRKVFDGVVHHYQQLSMSGRATNETPNPFFYVSSSEWNLYDFIREFATFNHLPKGVFLLGKMKRIRDFLHSGQNNHATKFNRIERIINTYPSMHFVLLGDDSQQDAYIYLNVISQFPNQILAVYIRKVADTNPVIVKVMDEMQSTGVSVCYFKHSSEALIHSKKIGLVLE